MGRFHPSPPLPPQKRGGCCDGPESQLLGNSLCEVLPPLGSGPPLEGLVVQKAPGTIDSSGSKETKRSLATPPELHSSRWVTNRCGQLGIVHLEHYPTPTLLEAAV